MSYTLANIMKSILTLIITFQLISISQAAEQLKFESVDKFLVWADAKLSANDYKALASAQVSSRHTLEARISLMKILDAKINDRALVEIFKGRTFPTDKNKFKLGGHDKELGHWHIDFLKHKGNWYLSRIWYCQ